MPAALASAALVVVAGFWGVVFLRRVREIEKLELS
jgi:hypothetical protein